ncbi:DUF3320 domain-containing protein [Streptomyces sp. PR69]|uniref:DUF3320 domain-containing protein n=1 Tax=Streptomyces sp. PR69 TaxID=2984950 RepID=UPI002264EC62|nr:DUF3320 domain-containing protein [Streptomyces sp. PR69]
MDRQEILNGAHGPGAAPRLQRLQTVLAGWRSSLIDLGGRNRLLHFRHTKAATLEITAPDAGTLLARLEQGWEFAPVMDADEGEAIENGAGGLDTASGPPGVVTQKTTQSSLDVALRALHRASIQAYNDFGLWVLWLGVGFLEWRESPDAQETNEAPLALLPVALERTPYGGFRLVPAQGQEPVHNPALAVKLDQLDIDWSSVSMADPADPAAVSAAARAAVAGLDGWRVADRMVLSPFASYKEAMYRDLLDNEEQILASDLIQAVGLGADAALPGDGLWFEPYDEQRIDELQIPETAPLVLDADASQRKSVAAALEGRSFVLEGPPGTGKSQTITNMIAALMQAGRSVLFVSEKAAALDVVRNRLCEVGLDSFVLALHSHDTSKKAVAVELGRSLAYRAQAPLSVRQDPEQARRLREELSAYAAAMNEPRAPLGHSLHQVIGMISLLDDRLASAGLPALPGPPADSDWAAGLDATALDELGEAARQVAGAWRPTLEGEQFPWYGLRETDSVADPRRLAEAAMAALDDLHRTAARHSALMVADGVSMNRLIGIRRAITELENLERDDDALAFGSAMSGRADVSGALHRVARAYGLPDPQDVAEAVNVCLLAGIADAEHRPLADWLDPTVLRQARAAAQTLQEAVALLREAKAAAEEAFDARVLSYEDLAELERRFREKHRGLLRGFSSRCRADRAAAAALTTTGVWNRTYAKRLPQALAWQSAHHAVARLTADFAALLGRHSQGEATDFAALKAALATAGRIAQLAPDAVADPIRRERLAHHLADGAPTDTVLRTDATRLHAALNIWRTDLAAHLEEWQRTTEDLLALFHTSRRARLSAEFNGEGGHESLDHARSILEQLCQDRSGPDEWRAHQAGLAVLRRHHIDGMVNRFGEYGVPAELLRPAVERAVLRAWADAQMAADTRLHAAVRAEDRNALVERFREADQRLVECARWAVLEACDARRPVGAAGQAATIRKEAEKKSRHMPVRELLSRARDVVRRLKPCLMMSPLTVSSYLPPDFRFDVVIFDEASQVRPEDAMGCIYRANSLIVAGDTRQLPPTAFFSADSGDDEEEWTEDALDSFPSLLEMCKGSGVFQCLPLRWHYRSRHEDLIAFSNHRFYGGGMVTFPGASEHGEDTGVAFFKADGVYARAGRRDNRAEAEFVARRVLHHFDTRPGMSLGVVALSKAQADTIDEEVQQARLARPDLDALFTEDRLDGFFVKNLEAVQGDERDVVILSVGYGPDAHGKLSLNFGPVNKEGGWRRLNVAITRARSRMEVVASFRGGELRDSDNRGVQELKRYLEYAERGPVALSTETPELSAVPESPFEDAVLSVLQDAGYDVRPQVGVAGYRIDFGVRHPRAVGSFAIGIECDGAMYHSSRAARDRDRLRQQVLEGLGWTLHRIWGTDWYRNRPEAERRLKQAVERAVAAEPFTARKQPEAPSLTSSNDGRQRVTLTAVESGARPRWSTHYQMADVSHLADVRVEPHTAEARPALARAIIAVVAVEGPVHVDLVLQRVRNAWGVGRAGSRIKANFDLAVTTLTSSGRIHRSRDGAFLDISGRSQLLPRMPAPDAPVRAVGYVPSAERCVAIAELAAESPGMTEEELIRHTARFFGWARVGDEIRHALASDIAGLVAQGILAGEPANILHARSSLRAG